ncbi:IQ domain-containing protein IQM6 [Citrus sinensis]|uniref:IQ domain-containing protein IQM6 n=1 Tax=Citrus sinensis TaxID=2711 RepID=A0ACB8JYB5_CITSI|nr:IQ domain-containing protein IQM6 [Citrus sinensis]
MGISFSYPVADFDDLDSPFGEVHLRSISLTEAANERSVLRKLSVNGRESNSKPTALRKKMIERLLSFERRALEGKFSFKTPSAEMDNQVFGNTMSFKDAESGDQSPGSYDFQDAKSHLPLEHGNQIYQAALRLQKVYKSFRTRRRLADCAVLAEQRWWKVLDFAELKRSSISFFDIDKNETALSRWSRARTRAAKVGKGLSKSEKARKLALQHWLEAIDPRHRYGHNLQFYYVTWLHCESQQPFFYWLDIGAGKEVNLERCPRSKLQQQCIKYLGPTERMEYEVRIEDGKLIYKKSGTVLDSTKGPKDTKWIFVLSTSKTLYVGQKIKGNFQHSSFLAGGATLSAGRLVVDNGYLKAIWPHSGHYLPTEENFQAFMSFLREHNVDLTNVKHPSDDGYETAEESFLSEEDFMVSKKNLFDEDAEENEKPVPKEKIMQRIDSHKGLKSYQLAQQLSSKWSTGAGPRIGCMRDYPSELQAQILELANLSPRASSSSRIRSHSCPRVLAPNSVSREILAKSPLAPEQVVVSQTKP